MVWRTTATACCVLAATMLSAQADRNDIPYKGLQTRVIHADVVVAGGGSAGSAAALAAARQGVETVLIHGRPMLGGNAASEDKLNQVGASLDGRRGKRLEVEAREGGIIEEYTLNNCVHNPDRDAVGLDFAIYDMVRHEKTLTLFLNTMLVAAEVDNTTKRITYVVAEDQYAQIRYEVHAKQFIDGTGDGRLGAEAGASFRMGWEGKKMYNESFQFTDEPSTQTQGSSLAFTARKTDSPRKYTPPTWAKKYNESEFVHRYIGALDYGYWWNEIADPYNTIRDNGPIRDELLENVFGIWDYVKNSGHFPDAANWSMDWFEWWPCKREGRRFEGEYVMRQSDVYPEPKLFDDCVSYGGWPFDMHNPKGMNDPAHPPNVAHSLKNIYGTPLRSLMANGDELGNLFFAGRLASFSWVVFGSQRVMKTAAVMGQAAGTAAAYAAKNSMQNNAKELYAPGTSHVWSIQQQLLRDDAYVIGQVNADPRDLAKFHSSSVTASSTYDSTTTADLILTGQTRAVYGSGGAAPGQFVSGTNRWISKSLPASIDVTFEFPVEVAEVQVVFDTGMHRALTLSVHSGFAGMLWGKPQPETVADYTVSAQTGPNTWITIADVKGNYQRRRVHTPTKAVQRVTALRILVTGTNGDDKAIVNEVRVYNTSGLAPFPSKL